MKNIILSALLLGGMNSATAQTWSQVSVPTQKQLNTIDFPSASVGYIGGNDSLLLKTTNGGQTWQPVSYTGVTFYPGNEHIVNLQFVSETTGFMTVGPYSGSYKTTNGGTTWQPVGLSSNMCYNEGLFFFDENNGFIAGSGCFQGELIDKLVDGVWSPATVSFTSSNADNRITDIDFLDADFGLATSYGGRFLRTTNGGQTWDSIASPLGAAAILTSVAILSNTLCYAGYARESGGFGLLTSEDGGLTWEGDEGLMLFSYPRFFDVHLTGSGRLYTAGEPYYEGAGMIFTSLDDGGWEFETTDEALYALASYSDSIVFAVGDNGYVITNRNFTLGIEEASYGALQLYPNPAETSISFQLPVSAPATSYDYRIVDLSGQTIREATIQTTTIDLADLLPGMYFLELRDSLRTFTERFVKK